MSMTRRHAIRAGMASAAGLWLADRVGAPLRAAGASGRAKAVIQIWMWGGPCHIDTFDPKPDAGYDYCGPLAKAIPTNADGIQVGELLPLLAKQADKYSIIRSMTHGINAHETASYAVQTGRNPGDRPPGDSGGLRPRHRQADGRRGKLRDLVQWQTDPALGRHWASFLVAMERQGRAVKCHVPTAPVPLPCNRDSWRAWNLIRRHRQMMPLGLGAAAPAGLDWPAVAVRLEVAGLWTPEIAEALAVCEAEMLSVEYVCRERDRDTEEVG